MTDDPTSAGPAPVDWLAHDTALRTLRDRLQPSNKQAVFDRLRENGVTRVVVTFDGYGDSGQIEEVTATAGETAVALPPGEVDLRCARWGRPDPEVLSVPVKAALELLAYDYLEQTHDGWEINEGAFGEFVFDVAEGEITLEYSERFIETEVSEHVF